MQNPYSVSITYRQNVKVIAEDIKEAIEKAKKIVGADEKKFEGIDYKVRQIPNPAKEPERTEELPFGSKKKKKA